MEGEVRDGLMMEWIALPGFSSSREALVGLGGVLSSSALPECRKDLYRRVASGGDYSCTLSTWTVNTSSLASHDGWLSGAVVGGSNQGSSADRLETHGQGLQSQTRWSCSEHKMGA